MAFGLRFLRLLPKLKKSCKPPAEDLPADYDPREDYCSLKFADIWSDAEMENVLEYLKGNSFLRIPDEWRSILMDNDQ